MPLPPAAARLAVHRWPGAPPVAQDGLVVISSADTAGSGREPARARIRLAVRQALAHITGLAPGNITLHSTPGQAPGVSFGNNGEVYGAGLSISHVEGLSLAAINLHGAVGVDLMQVQAFPDWHAVAHDYLGPAVAARLADMAPEHRPRAFAKAWTEREASLKCLGLALSEWSAWSGSRSAGCRCLELDLPAGLSGTIAIPMLGARG
jgi:4'-phosphopantetheinyl transferase